jgi:hypothetical protein
MRRVATLLIVSVLGFLVGGNAHSESRVSGTYVLRGTGYAAMLQLTETSGGNINGVLSEITLRQDGNIDPEQGAITGTVPPRSWERRGWVR